MAPSSLDPQPARSVRSALVASVVAVGDPDGTRTVTSIVALLVVLGVAMVMLAIWLFRTTRPDHELLAPLEVMGERRWRRADPVWQRRRLDAVRPPEAQPLQPSASPPDLDEAFDAGPLASGFDDLRGEIVVAAAASGVSGVSAVSATVGEPVADGSDVVSEQQEEEQREEESVVDSELLEIDGIDADFADSTDDPPIAQPSLPGLAGAGNAAPD